MKGRYEGGKGSNPCYLLGGRHVRHPLKLRFCAEGACPQSVALIVKSFVRMMAGEEAARGVAGHSLRAGYCTEAATVGLQPYQIRDQTGHQSDVTLARYIRPVAKRKIPGLL